MANTMKYLDGQPLVGVNPDPHRYDGVLLPFRPNEVRCVLPEVLAGRRAVKSVTMAQAALSDGQCSTRSMTCSLDQKLIRRLVTRSLCAMSRETQSSSGIIISTGLGSTAWMRSVFTGASMLMQASRRSRNLPTFEAVPWDAPFLRFAVREPFPSVATQTNLGIRTSR